MGGEIGVESADGEGSTFWFTALFDKQIELDFVQTKEKFDITDKKVLIVDDHRTNRYILREYLKSWGCSIVEASEGKKALDILKDSVSSKEAFDLILTGCQMPEMSGFDLAREIRKEESLKNVPIILITSVGEIGDAKSSKDIGIQAYLTKPIRQDYLHKAIESVLGCFMKEEDQPGPQLVTKHTVAEEYVLKDFRILLAEDYPTNQEVAIRHLQRAGYQVDLAENGQQATDLCKRKHYDLILMDIQMPVMDGFKATEKIRSHEKELAGPNSQAATRSVIIAMTAHAQEKYREKCLESGMDDYISKPLRRRELLAIVDKWVNKIAESPLSLGTEEAGTQKLQPEKTENRQYQKIVPIDFNRAIEEFEGDREYLMKVFEGFLKNVSNQIKTICQALSDGNAEVVWKEAHSIKGGAANLTADNLSKIASELENIGKSGDLKEGNDILEKLEKEYQCLVDYVRNK
jgi:CheY-like chemotaxis protein/HPt (histidine-containing phosphotransfer) domain-containing protein